MNALEFELRREIAELRKRISRLEEKEDDFNERIRRILVEYGLTEGAAEDE